MPVTVQNDSLNPRKVYYKVGGMAKFVILKGQEVFTIQEIDDPNALMNRVSVLKYQIEQKTANSNKPKQSIFDVNGNYVRVSSFSRNTAPVTYRSTLFNNTSKYLYVDDNSDINFNAESFSISFWFKFIDQGVESVVRKLKDVGLGPDFGYFLGFNATNPEEISALFSTNSGIDVSTSNSPTLSCSGGTWHLVTAVSNYDGRTAFQFVQLNLSASTNSATESNIGSDGAPLYIGTSNSTKIDEVTLWNKALSSAEISELYNSGSGITINEHSASGSVISHYSMGENVSFPAGLYYDTFGNYNANISGLTIANLSTDGVGTIGL